MKCLGVVFGNARACAVHPAKHDLRFFIPLFSRPLEKSDGLPLGGLRALCMHEAPIARYIYIY